MKHYLIDTKEATDKIVQFVNSDKIDSLLDRVKEDKKSAFAAGMLLAIPVAVAECKAMVYVDEDNDS